MEKTDIAYVYFDDTEDPGKEPKAMDEEAQAVHDRIMKNKQDILRSCRKQL